MSLPGRFSLSRGVPSFFRLPGLRSYSSFRGGRGTVSSLREPEGVLMGAVHAGTREKQEGGIKGTERYSCCY